jgi:F420-non-reducing hydrogenase iron-sulfur subunit
MSCESPLTLCNTPAGAPLAEVQSPLKIVAFLCTWCSFAAADKAGLKRLLVPAEITIIKVNCSGRVEPTLILEALRQGAAGVMVMACHPGDCHYQEGNLRAQCRALLLERLLPQMGIPAERFRFLYLASAEAEHFSQATAEFVQSLHALSGRRKERGGIETCP